MLASYTASSVLNEGWAVIETGIEKCVDLESWILAAGKQFGDVCTSRRGSNLIDVLTPTIRSKSRSPSLSKKFGRSSFPLHCDTAFWPTPCRYIVLGCVRPGSSPAATLILDTAKLSFSDEERKSIEQAIYVVNNGRRSFYCSIMNSSQPFFRFDPGCMEPQCKKGAYVIDLLSAERNQDLVVRYNWKVGDVLIIDNWRILHGREQCEFDEDERKLLRVTVQ